MYFLFVFKSNFHIQLHSWMPHMPCITGLLGTFGMHKCEKLAYGLMPCYMWQLGCSRCHLEIHIQPVKDIPKLHRQNKNKTKNSNNFKIMQKAFKKDCSNCWLSMRDRGVVSFFSSFFVQMWTWPESETYCDRDIGKCLFKELKAFCLQLAWENWSTTMGFHCSVAFLVLLFWYNICFDYCIFKCSNQVPPEFTC